MRKFPLADNLKKLRIARNMSQKEVAAKVGLTLSGYQSLEYGDRNARAETLMRLAECFDVELACLFGKEPAPKGTENVISDEMIITIPLKDLKAIIRTELERIFSWKQPQV